MPARPLPRDLYTASGVRALDQAAIAGAGIPARVLMERAGAATFRALTEAFPGAKALAVICGAGNNGGDGFVVARLARAAGLGVAVRTLGNLERLPAEAAAMLAELRAGGVEPRPYGPDPDLWEQADVVVDAVFGTGLTREVEGSHAEAIRSMNAAGCPVVAADIPSGLHADRGTALGPCAQAALTVTFIGLKQGLFTGAGPAHAGAVVFEDLAVPASIYAEVERSAVRIDAAALGSLPARARDAHKGSHGHVLIVGGDHGYPGAPQLAATAAARAGAGLVSVATRGAHAALLAVARAELMAHGVDAPAELEPLLDCAGVLAIGPGLGTGAWGQAMLEAALRCALPLVVDADGLNLLARAPVARGNWVLTPHPGEAGRLLGDSTAAVERDRFAAAAAIAERYRAVCVLKGAGTLVAAPGRETRICSAGNPGMATGGAGDVLTGVVAAMVAQGLGGPAGGAEPLAGAADLAVAAHAHAGDLAAACGERGMLAGDIIAQLRRALNPV